MDAAEREQRIAELRRMQLSNPRDLIEHYCRIAGAMSGSQMPRGVSFSRMIDAIVEYEATTRSSSQPTT